MKKEYVMMLETMSDTQKKIRTWISTGYTIEMLKQFEKSGTNLIYTSLFRYK